MNSFIDSNLDSLIQIYIKERKTNNNELGVLFIIFKEEEKKVDVKFFPLSNALISDELRNDIIKKNNSRNSYVFFLVINEKENLTNLIVKDLEQK